MNIEREAKKAIRDEAEPFGVSVRFSPHRHDMVKCTLSDGPKPAIFYFHRSSNRPSTIKHITLDARKALRHLGKIKPPSRLGPIGEALMEAIPVQQRRRLLLNGVVTPEMLVVGREPIVPVSEPELLCPDAIAEARHQQEEPKPMNVVTPTKLFRQPAPSRTPKTDRKHLSQEQAIEISRLLTKHGDMVNGAFVYAEGWSDERITELTKPATGLAGVVKVRRKSFGTMANEVQQTKGHRGGSRLEQLELALGDIKHDVAGLAQRVTALEDAVTKG